MSFYLIYYFTGIYLIIAEYTLLSDKFPKYYIMCSLHLIFTVPSSYFIATRITELMKLNGIGYTVLFSILFAVLSLLLSGIIVSRIRNNKSN
jgi:hypothetical protein